MCRFPNLCKALSTRRGWVINEVDSLLQPHWVRPASKGVIKAERAHGKQQAISPLSSGHVAKGSLHVIQGPHGCYCADANYTSLTGVNWKSNRSFVFSDRHVPKPPFLCSNRQFSLHTSTPLPSQYFPLGGLYHPLSAVTHPSYFQVRRDHLPPDLSYQCDADKYVVSET